MPFHLIDALLGGSMLTLALLASTAFGFCAYHIPFLSEGFAAIVSVVVFMLSVILITGWQGRLIHRHFPLQPGVFSVEIPGKEANVWKLLGFLNLFNLSLLIHTYLCPVTLRWLVYRFLGAKIGGNVMIGGKIIEPWMVAVGSNVVLGEDCLVLGHVISRNQVTLDRVVIGDNVTIGVKAIVMPGVTVGDGAVVWAGAVVPRGSRIGPGEEWAGVPARRVRKHEASESASRNSDASD